METNQNTNTQKTSPEVNMGNKLIIISVVALLTGVAIGYGLSFFMDSKPDTNEQHEALKQAVRDQYPEYFEADEFGTFYSGTVQEVKADSIIIKTDIPDILLLASDLEETKEIKIDAGTQIIKEIQKDPEQYAQELAQYEIAYSEYEAQLNNLSEEEAIDGTFDTLGPQFPSSIEETDINVSEIKPGERVSVSVQADEALAGAEDDLDDVNQAPDMITIIRVQEVFEDEFFDDALPEEIEGGSAEPATP